MAIVTTNQNLTAVSYVAGEIIEIRSGATLTINSTPATRPGTIQCITSGKCRIENSSTATPIVVELEDMNRDFRFEGNGILEIRGAMMNLGTGTGAAQTFDFASLYSGVLTDVTYVEVEQTAGSGDYMPWHIVEVASRYYHVGRSSDRGSITTEYDGNQPVFFWNSDTRVLSTGNGTNGMSVPSGCNIRIPNILLTNRDWQPDATLVHAIISEGTPTGGTFTITVTNGRTGATLGTTSALAFNATAAAIDTALEAVLGAGTITNSGGPLPTAVTITLAGAFANTPLRFTVNSSVTGGTNSVIYSRESSSANMTLLDLNPSGTLDAEMCMFSRKVRILNEAFTSVRAVRVGFGGHARQLSNSNGTLTFDHTHSGFNPYTASSSHQILNVFGAVSLDKTVTTTGLAQTTSFHQTLLNLSLDRDTRHLAYGSRTSTAGTCFTHLNVSPIDIVRPRVVGGRHQLTNLVGNAIVNPSACDHPGTAQLTTNAQSQWSFTNCNGLRFINPTKAGTASARNYAFLISADSPNIQVYGGSYDMSNNGNGAVSPAASGLVVQDFTVTNVRASGNSHDLPASFVGTTSTLRRMYSTAFSGDLTIDAIRGGVFDLVGCSIAGFGEVHASVEDFVGGNFANLGSSPTTGHVTFGAFGRGSSLSLTGAGAYTDQTGSIVMEANADEAIATMPFAMHGITGFTNTAPTFIAESEGGFSDRWRILNDGGITGGTFTLTFYDSSNVLIGTTIAIAFNATTATVDAAVETVLGAGTVTVSGGLLTGYIITLTAGTIVRCTVDGALLTGGTKPNTANALGRHNIGIALGTALTAGTTVGGMTIEHSMRNPGGVWSSWATLTASSTGTQFAALSGYSANTGLEMRMRFTASGDDPYRRISQISMPTTIDPSLWILGDATITLQGPNPTDVSRIVRASDNTTLYSFTGAGTFSFSAAANFGTEVYMRREDSGGTVLMRTLPQTFLLKLGDNGIIPLFYGAEVQLAQSSDVTAIKATVDLYLDAAISSRLATAGYTAPPTAAAIRTEIDTNSTRLDVAVSTRLAAADYTAPANSDIAAIKAKTDNLPSDPADESSIQAAIAAIPSAPSASTVASAVRTELTTELGRIDVATSTRLATSGYTAPANADIAAILVDTGTTIPAQISALNNLSAADVNAQVDIALADYDGPTKAELDSAEADIIAALPAAAPSASTVASAVRTELTTELGRIDVATSTRLATSGYTAPANADIAAILVDTGTTLPAQISALNNLSAADVNAQVDIALADYDAPTKAELDAAQAAIIAEVDANETKIDTIDTVVDAIKLKTDNLPTDPADESSIQDSLNTINEGVKKASLLIPHSEDL